MIESMTGYGKGESTASGITYTVELRSVNNRFLEISTRTPRILSHRDNDIKEVVRTKINRGKVSINAMKVEENDKNLSLTLDTAKARSVVDLLNALRKKTKIRETVKLEHLLHFSEIFEPAASVEDDEQDWKIFRSALEQALTALKSMREKEGAELAADMRARVEKINVTIDTVEQLSKQQIPEERVKLQERITAMLEDHSVMNAQRLELEIALLSDRLDVTEECVRFRSHNKFFLQALRAKESEGRKLNFLIQEMNREANTIGSKSNSVEIAHAVVGIKEELEKIREQLQNIE